MPKFHVPYSLEYVGHVTVVAPSEEEAKKIVEDMDTTVLLSKSEHSTVEAFEVEVAKTS